MTNVETPGQGGMKIWQLIGLAAVPWLVFVVTGFMGLDLGLHWDERSFVERIAKEYRNGTILPGNYDYPGFIYIPAHLALLPEVITEWARPGVKWSMVRQRMAQRLDEYHSHMSVVATAPDKALKTRNKFSSFSGPAVGNWAGHRYQMRVRAICLLISSLLIFWVFFATYAWQRNPLAAFLAAALVAGSWEIAYHARWYAADTITTQFAMLTLWLVILSQVRPKGRIFVRLAALAAGLALATKYPLGLLILPVLAAGWLVTRGARWSERILFFMQLGFIFVLTFTVVTPGILLEPFKLVEGIRYEMQHYATGHVRYNVAPGLPLMGRILIYYGLIFFSHYPWISAICAVFAVVGLIRLFRQSWRLAALVFCFPVIYALYMSTQKVMTVRNLLPPTPFLAIAAACGLAALLRLPALRPAVRWALGSAVGALLLVNAVWLFQAAESIRARGTDAYVRQLDRYLARHSSDRIYLSPTVAQVLQAVLPKARPNVTRDWKQASLAIFFFHDQGRYSKENPYSAIDWFPTNDPFMLVRWFGPYEVNMNYYGTWAGDDRILVMKMEKARQLGINALR